MLVVFGESAMAGMTIQTCKDEHGVVHIGFNDNTWCGWRRVWEDGEWTLVENATVSCLQCIAFDEGLLSAMLEYMKGQDDQQRHEAMTGMFESLLTVTRRA